MDKKVVANRITKGDKHDLSIEWYITHTSFPEYKIYRLPNGHWAIVGWNPEKPAEKEKSEEKVAKEKPKTVKRSKKKKKNGT